MASAILYKFRSGTTFEALPLPGSAARLFDVKKAIVLAKKLDQGSMEFDLSVRDATTNVEYTDDTMLLPRGARLVVQRLPVARGHGILAKMARSQLGVGHTAAGPLGDAAPSNFYTIDTRANDDEDEFISTKTAEEKELEALRAVTDASQRNTASTSIRPGVGFRPGAAAASAAGPPRHQRPNADPELRELQQRESQQPKKRATGIPRTFLSLSAPAKTTDGEGNESNVLTIQPNTVGFEELINRGGGQSENASGSKRDLDYALKLTASTIPEYLQCSICGGIVKDAMILPWDAEGRTTCEMCIRDALTQNGFRCPLTGQEGVSPDDLLPNLALRKAAEQFVKKIIQQMEEIEKQQVEEDKASESADGGDGTSNLLEGDGADKGVILTKRATVAERRKKQEEEDPFGGKDDFGGDVFAVAVGKEVEQEENNEGVSEPDKPPVQTPQVKMKVDDVAISEKDNLNSAPSPVIPSAERSDNHNGTSQAEHLIVETTARPKSPTLNEQSPHDPSSGNRRDRRRGPPAGYTMGPAGGAAGGPRETTHARSYNDSDGGRGRGSGSRFRGGRNWNERGGAWNADGPGRRDDQNFGNESGARPPKRPRADSTEGGPDEHSSTTSSHFHDRHDDYSGGRNSYRGRGPPRGGGYGGRGRGGHDDFGGGRGGNFRGRGRGGFRGGRGRF
ncbi:protein MPE1 [Fistulifera solaris]|uniref:Protein MPE1 n=1 Tax=Fistulifera solaris TaxID=1519565 RepID=A0A1Z5JIW1_FISSO|nr:protein MPE1 [Fistulifera solaris]|eukprot:GAX13934.1 protein MPE1 [Fistulifera solaris]